VVVDVAAGTGKLTRRLLASGARVIAAEPLEEMRSVLVRLAPGAEMLAGTAEALPLLDGIADAAVPVPLPHRRVCVPARAESVAAA